MLKKHADSKKRGLVYDPTEGIASYVNAVNVWVPEDERTPRVLAACEAFGCELKSRIKGKAIWAVADGPAKPAVDYRDYEWPEVGQYTLCFGPNEKSAEPLIKAGADRIHIPQPLWSLFADQALTILLLHIAQLEESKQ